MAPGKKDACGDNGPPTAAGGNRGRSDLRPIAKNRKGSDRPRRVGDHCLLDAQRVHGGGRIIEIPGEGGATKTDSLARRLEGVLADTRVTRPIKTAEVRVGLEESATPSEVAGALAKASGCTAAEIKAGLIRAGPAGMGTIQAQCPVVVANRLVTVGRLLMGWTMA